MTYWGNCTETARLTGETTVVVSEVKNKIRPLCITRR